MFGIDDPGIYLAYLGCILCLIIGIVYGIITWNKGAPKENEVTTDYEWEVKHEKIEDELTKTE